MQIYEGKIPLYHFDFYRVEQVRDLLDIGFEEYIYGHGVSIIEWADKFTEVLPRERLTVIIENGEDTEAQRRITLKAVGSRYHILLEEMHKTCMF
jgi:tRNA threonylcarbamoyladenosine biosynthesis protein TsaE